MVDMKQSDTRKNKYILGPFGGWLSPSYRIVFKDYTEDDNKSYNWKIRLEKKGRIDGMWAEKYSTHFYEDAETYPDRRFEAKHE